MEQQVLFRSDYSCRTITETTFTSHSLISSALDSSLVFERMSKVTPTGLSPGFHLGFQLLHERFNKGNDLAQYLVQPHDRILCGER